MTHIMASLEFLNRDCVIVNFSSAPPFGFPKYVPESPFAFARGGQRLEFSLVQTKR